MGNKGCGCSRKLQIPGSKQLRQVVLQSEVSQIKCFFGSSLVLQGDYFNQCVPLLESRIYGNSFKQIPPWLAVRLAAAPVERLKDVARLTDMLCELVDKPVLETMSLRDCVLIGCRLLGNTEPNEVGQVTSCWKSFACG